MLTLPFEEARADINQMQPESVAVSSSGTKITVEGKTWNVPYSVLQVMAVGERILVVYDWMEAPQHRQFQNLQAYTIDGIRLWIAEHQNNETVGAC